MNEFEALKRDISNGVLAQRRQEPVLRPRPRRGFREKAEALIRGWRPGTRVKLPAGFVPYLRFRGLRRGA